MGKEKKLEVKLFLTLLIILIAILTLIPRQKFIGSVVIVVGNKYTGTMMVSLGDAVTFRTVYYVVSKQGDTYHLYKHDYDAITIGDQVKLMIFNDGLALLSK